MYNIIRQLHIELTDKCNARCPQCIRTNVNTGETESWILKKELYFKDFKSILTPIDLHNLYHINFCGNYGEPLAARDLIPILKYCYEYNPKLSINVATNGNVRSEDWWWELLEVVNNKNFVIVFGLDGSCQEEHVMYRRGTNFDKILENAEIFISNGGIADWQYLIFKHNENSIEKARKKSEKMGFRQFLPVSTERFWTGDKFEYTHKNKKYELERSSVEPNKKQLMNIKHYSEKKEIRCFAKARQEAYIDCLGYITPCCYLGMYLYASVVGLPKDFHNQQELMLMFNNMDLERLKGPLNKVIKDPWFSELVQMHTEFKPERCYKVCGAEINKKEYVNETI